MRVAFIRFRVRFHLLLCLSWKFEPERAQLQGHRLTLEPRETISEQRGGGHGHTVLLNSKKVDQSEK
jgi:hypothetical protein